MAYLYMPEKLGSVRNPYSAIGMIGVVVNRKSRGYVAWVQSALNQIMGPQLKVDGIMGPKTRSVIRSFQQEKGLKVDGIVGSKTEAALRAEGAPPLPWEDSTTSVEGQLGALVSSPGCAGLSGIKSRWWGFEVWLNSCLAEGLPQSAGATTAVGTPICGALMLATGTVGGAVCAAVAGEFIAFQYVIVAGNTWGGKRGVKIFFMPNLTPFAIYPQ